MQSSVRVALAGLLLGLLLALRPSYFVLALLPLWLGLAQKGTRVRFVLPIALVGLTSLLFVWQADGWAYFSEGRRFTDGHFTLWGNTAAAHGDRLLSWARTFNEQLTRVDQAVQNERRFIADAAHELRTPLAVLRGELEAMEDGVRPLTPAGISSLQAEVKSLGKLVSDLYDLSLSDVGALTYRMRRIDLRDVLGQSLQGFQERLSSHALALDCVLPDEPLPIDDARPRVLLGGSSAMGGTREITVNSGAMGE